MLKILHAFLLVIACTLSMPVFGSDMQNEIDHLIQFVENTQCRYERNGTFHNGKDAADHIRKKYRYFKDKIDSTEKFIELSATRSTMSGKIYMIHCQDASSVTSQQWLLQELQNYRATKQTGH